MPNIYQSLKQHPNKIMPFSTSTDTKAKKKIYAFAKDTKTGIFHSWEKAKGLVNGKPDQIYKLLQSNEGN